MKTKKILIDHDKESKSVLISWGKLGKQHIGVSEEINLIGCQITIDRNKKGRVKMLEIFYW